MNSKRQLNISNKSSKINEMRRKYEGGATNSRQFEYETDLLKKLSRALQAQGVEINTASAERTAVTLQVPTNIVASEASAAQLHAIASFHGELNQSYIVIKRPVVWSYGKLGALSLWVSSWLFTIWYYYGGKL